MAFGFPSVFTFFLFVNQTGSYLNTMLSNMSHKPAISQTQNMG